MIKPKNRLAAVMMWGPAAGKRIDAGYCPRCGCKPEARGFSDEKSLDEYGITGLCEPCQDVVFREQER